jgi:hypothetical protein
MCDAKRVGENVNRGLPRSQHPTLPRDTCVAVRLYKVPMVEKTSGIFAHRFNFIWEKQVGAGADQKYMFRYSYSGTYAMSAAFRPGVEAYARPDDHAYQAEPIVAGAWHSRQPCVRGARRAAGLQNRLTYCFVEIRFDVAIGCAY